MLPPAFLIVLTTGCAGLLITSNIAIAANVLENDASKDTIITKLILHCQSQSFKAKEGEY